MDEYDKKNYKLGDLKKIPLENEENQLLDFQCPDVLSLHICSQGIMLLGFPQYELELVHTGS